MSQAIYDVGSQSFDPMWEEACADPWRSDTYVEKIATPMCFWTVRLLDIFGKTCTVSVMVFACDCDCVVSSIVALTTSYIRVLHFCGQVPFLYVIIVGCIHTCIHACMHTYLPTYIHTYIHDLSPPPLSFLPSLSPLKPLKLILGRSWLVGSSGPLINKLKHVLQHLATKIEELLKQLLRKNNLNTCWNNFEQFLKQFQTILNNGWNNFQQFWTNGWNNFQQFWTMFETILNNFEQLLK